jgi:Domain of unknown function (DUF4333)
VRSLTRNRINRRACLSTALALQAAVLALAGCQVSVSAGGLDYEKLESEITGELNKRYTQIAREVSNVECPRLTPAPKTGDTFTCNADVEGHAVRVEVKVRDDDYNVDFSTLDAVFDLENAGRLLAEEVSAELGFPVTVSCGEGLKVVAIGDSLECTAADSDGDERTVRLTAGSVDEADHWEVLD